MLEIKCPYCGVRPQVEFAYGGDATVKRPELNKEITDLKVEKQNIDLKYTEKNKQITKQLLLN